MRRSIIYLTVCAVMQILASGVEGYLTDDKEEGAQNQKSDMESGQQKCLALAMRAGGVKGIYEVGVFQSFFDKGHKDEVAYDVTVGTSIGAVNAAIIAMFPKGDESSAYKMLYSQWINKETSDIFTEWPTWGPLAGLWRSSFFDNTPTHHSINSQIDIHPLQRQFVFQTVNIDDGSILWFDETTKKSMIGEAIAASSSIPIVFQPTESFSNMHLVDGGTYSFMNLQSAISKCRQITKQSDSDITIDVILDQDDPLKLPEFSLTDQSSWSFPFSIFSSSGSLFNPLRILYRVLVDFKAYYTTLNDLLPIVRLQPEVNYRHIVAPSEPLPGSKIPIFIDKEEQREIWALGYRDGHNSIKKAGPNEWLRREVEFQKHNIEREGFD